MFVGKKLFNKNLATPVVDGNCLLILSRPHFCCRQDSAFKESNHRKPKLHRKISITKQDRYVKLAIPFSLSMALRPIK